MKLSLRFYSGSFFHSGLQRETKKNVGFHSNPLGKLNKRLIRYYLFYVNSSALSSLILSFNPRTIYSIHIYC
uniref:Uncharacterized protein n=1 Tax=Lepeophtheirus salmonis TaxID=72036 RepID=A0A0K2TKA7_LEPSM